MKNLLRIAVFLTMFLMLSITLTACIQKEPIVLEVDDTYIVIKVSSEQMEITSGMTLLEYMQELKEDGKLGFDVDNGMLSAINGIKNPSDWSSCWMLYTSDVDNANASWGEVEYKSNIYGSAIFGAEQLKIKDGCLYIWVYQSF